MPNVVYGVENKKSDEWNLACRDELDNREVEAVITVLGRLRPNSKGSQKELLTEIDNFRRRMIREFHFALSNRNRILKMKC